MSICQETSGSGHRVCDRDATHECYEGGGIYLQYCDEHACRDCTPIAATPPSSMEKP